MLKKRTLAAGAAALGIAMVVGALLAPSAGAQQEALTIFSANAVARGLGVTGGLKPFIIDPIVDVSGPFVRAVMNSQPESHSLAAAFFPGDLLYSQIPGYPLAVDADSGAPQTQDRTLAIVGGLPTEQAGLTSDTIFLHAVAKPEENRSTATIHRLLFQPAGQKNPLVSIDAIKVATDAVKQANELTMVSTARAHNIGLLGGMLRIGSIVSTARTVTNGTEITEKSAIVEITGAELIDSNGQAHRATIDNEGIHVEDPSLPPGVNQNLSSVVQYLLGRAGITISTLDTTTTSEGAAGDAFAGGLLIALDTGPCEVCVGTIIGQLPPEVRQVLSQITEPLSKQKICPAPPPLPCVTTGLIPTSPQVASAITIASAAATVSGALENVPSVGGGVETGGGGEVSGGAEIPGGSFVPGAEGGEVSTGGGEAAGSPGGALTGLASNMPDPLLATLGVIFLLIAMGLLVGPSFRRQT